MATAVTVELGDLRGFADVVDDISGYLGRASGYAATHCSSTDFGPMLDPLASDYGTLLPQMQQLLADQVELVRAAAVSLDQTLQDFRTTDAQEAERHGGGVTITDDGKSTTFWGNPLTEFRSPVPNESELPEIDFGFPFDQLAWALEKICGYDVRREVTDWLVGDVVEVSTQSSAWFVVGSATDSYAWHIGNANTIIARTWTGDAADAAVAKMGEWQDALAQQGIDFDQIGAHLSDIAADAVDMAQLAIDLIKFAVDLIAAAWASQWIPIYGQAKFAVKAWDAYHKAKEAWDKLQLFLDLLKLILGYFEILHSKLNPVNLPAAPSTA